jgi:regulator of protease activity HflC (stomatin/prohibitin superfamily)
VKAIGPGLHWYWPLVTEFYTTAIVRQTQNLPVQAAVTKDKIAVAVSGIVVYKIVDIVAALSKTWDFNDTLSDVSMTAILAYVRTHTYDELIEGSAQDNLTKRVRQALRRYGVSVAQVGLTDLTEATALNHIGASWQSLPGQNGTS